MPTTHAEIVNAELLVGFPEGPPQGGLSVSARYIANVRYWHKADMDLCTANVRFRG